MYNYVYIYIYIYIYMGLQKVFSVQKTIKRMRNIMSIDAVENSFAYINFINPIS